MSETMIEEKTATAKEVLRSGWLAYLGLYGAAYERLLPRVEKLNASTNTVFTELVSKGAAVEATAQEKIEDVREAATDRYGDRFAKFRNMMPAVGNDNAEVAELHQEIEALNKKITALTKKVGTIDKAVKTA